MRTPDEIVARIRYLEEGDRDFLFFERSDLIEHLPFSHARPFLKPEAAESDWEQLPLSAPSIQAEMLDYMPFAWEKANNCRGISASRSISHMKAWLWLRGDDLGERMDGLYEFYGKPCLRVICEKYGWDWREWDDGRWGNSESGPFYPAPERIEMP